MFFQIQRTEVKLNSLQSSEDFIVYCQKSCFLYNYVCMVYKKVICWNLFISILKLTSSRANIKQYIPLSVPSCRNLHYSPNIEWTTIWVASRKIIFSRYILREFTVSEYQPLCCGWRYVFVVIAEKRQRLRWVLYLSIPLQSLYTHALCLCVPGFFVQVCGFIGTQILPLFEARVFYKLGRLQRTTQN